MLDAGDTAGAPVAAAEHQRAAEAEGRREEADVKRVSSSSSSPSIDADAAAGKDDASRLRALFCTLEFSSDTFSGNGTLAQACVRGLASAGVDVVCLAARPQSVNDDGGEEEKVSPSSRDDRRRLHGASELVEVPVPRALWGRLDARSPWREFRDGATARAETLPDLSSFDVVFAVDWTGVAAAEALLEAASATGEGEEKKKRPPPIIYLNFRVFARSAETPLDRELVRRAEGRAVAVAAEASVALCAADAVDLLLLAQEEQEEKGEGGPPPAMTVLLPPLRKEFAEMPPPPEEEEEEGRGRRGRPASSSDCRFV